MPVLSLIPANAGALDEPELGQSVTGRSTYPVVCCVSALHW
ncbi:hypothetical protein O1W68_12130 [Rhodococcus sp. H36-A4]|nr:MULTISPECIES: hypothetical protein [unclassified Rhodococcus (in: high G+C Gram-positive bacteria)]MCZ4078693.1 hypothetical protein [Rhodococcus sp. H36-A4]